MTFEVGQKVVIVRAANMPELIGKVTTVVRGLHPYRSVQTGRIRRGYSIDILGSNGRPIAAGPGDLRPWYDGDAPGSWRELNEIWSPRTASC